MSFFSYVLVVVYIFWVIYTNICTNIRSKGISSRKIQLVCIHANNSRM